MLTFQQFQEELSKAEKRSVSMAYKGGGRNSPETLQKARSKLGGSKTYSKKVGSLMSKGYKRANAEQDKRLRMDGMTNKGARYSDFKSAKATKGDIHHKIEYNKNFHRAGVKDSHVKAAAARHDSDPKR